MTKSTIQANIVKKFLQMRVENSECFYSHPSLTLEQRLLTAISRGELVEAKDAMKEINSLPRPKLAQNHLRSLKNSLICSCTLFTRAIIKGGVDPESAFNLSDVYIQQIEETNELVFLEQLEYEMLITFIQTRNDSHKTSYQYVVNKALSYIHQEIFHDLSLEQIADFLGIHPSYLSRVFKDEVGITITEYISRKRIEDSKFFLLHSDSTISDIAILFNFCNQSYFTSIFKKHTGVTPKQFRSNNHDVVVSQ